MSMNHLTRRNKNRGYMKLEVWQKAIQLLGVIGNTLSQEARVDFKLRSQILDSAQSVSSNIAEGYCRRSVKEYIQFLYIGLASMGETMTRLIGLKTLHQITSQQFERIDALHYEIENKLLKLV